MKTSTEVTEKLKQTLNRQPAYIKSILTDGSKLIVIETDRFTPKDIKNISNEMSEYFNLDMKELKVIPATDTRYYLDRVSYVVSR